MNEKKDNAQSVTAKDLLSRLQKSKSAEGAKPSPKKSATYNDFIANREKTQPKAVKAKKIEEKVELPAFEEELNTAEFIGEEVDFAAVYDSVYAESRENAAEVYGDFAPQEELAKEQYAAEEEYVQYDNAEYGYAEDVQYAEEPVADEYAQYFAQADAQYSDELADAGEYADIESAIADELSDYEGFVPEDTYSDTYTEEFVIPEDGEYYEDVLPEDDFFDNDPLDEPVEEYYEEEAESLEDEEYDEEKAFEQLVEEVTGGAPVDEIDATDISLMVALGMEDALVETVGEDVAAQITDDYVADQEEWVDRTNRFGSDEYSDVAQNREIAEEYTKRKNFSFIKLIAGIVLTFVLLFFENLPVVGLQHAGLFDPAVYPIVFIMADLQLLLFMVALVFPHITKGLKDMLSFKFSVDSLPALLSIAAIVNSVIMVITSKPEALPVSFNFVVALCLLFTAFNEYMTVRREIFSFNIVSSKRPKFVMRRLSQRDSVLESEAVAELDSQVADEGDIIKIQKTDFVDGYFWRTKIKSTVGRSVIGLAATISVALAVIVTIYAFFAKVDYPINAGFATLCAAIPASMVVVGFYPFYRANRRAYDSDSTIIGEGSIEEYSGVGVISFDDVNVFPSHSVKVRNVRLFNNSRIDKVLYYAASVFCSTGGPLADVFEVATMETGHSDNVTILETGTGYIEAEVNGKSIMFGRAQALAKHGILIPEEVMSETTELPVDCSVMYMIYQRKLVAKMIVNYVLDSDFEYVLKQLTGSGMCVCVKTFDPNIDEEMICRQLPSNNYAMRVIKYKNTEEITKYSQRAEGGIVSRGSTKSLLHTVSSCDKVISAQKTGFIIGIVSAILNVIIMAVVLMAGSFSSMYSLYVVLCQLFWLVPVVITTKIIVR